MAYYDYLHSRKIEALNEPFYVLLMAAMRKADDVNTAKFAHAWPTIWLELHRRYNGPGGCLNWDEWKQVHAKELEGMDVAQVAALQRELSERFVEVEEQATKAMQEYVNPNHIFHEEVS